MTDISQEERIARLEACLRESEERFQAFSRRFLDITETTLEWIWEVDSEGRYIYASPVVKKILGYDPDEVLGKHFYDFFHPEDRDRLKTAAFEVFARKEPFREFSNRNVHRDGRTVWLSTSGVPVLDDHGSFLGYRGADMDITDRKRADEERINLEHRVQQAQKVESLGVLAGGIAHDFNNLLLGIMGNAGMALARLDPESPARSSLEKIQTAAERAAELTNRLLAYSGKGRFVVETVDLSGLVEEMVHLLEEVISKNAILEFDFARDLPLLAVDAAQIRQVAMNLITNASDAIKGNGGVIKVATGIFEAGRSYLEGTFSFEELPEGDYVYFEVSDNGCGMDGETRQQMFDPFFTTKSSGRGLGLSAVLGIVRGHKGAIHLDSEPGKGTTVRVLFPVKTIPEKPPAEMTVDVQGWQGQGLVLVVDDDEIVLETARSMLELIGFEVITTRDGHEALEVFAEHADVRVVLLDMSMPGMDGKETFGKLREIRPDVRVILSSGYTEQDWASHFAAEGPSGFVQKPYTLKKLIEVVRETLTSP